MSIQLRGGKLAPRLLTDLGLYDPRFSKPEDLNTLTNVRFHDEGNEPLSPPPGPPGACKHDWSLKQKQCIVPATNGDRPAISDTWQFKTYCLHCRSHADVDIGFRKRDREFAPCPAFAHPMHHFVHQPRLSTSWQDRNTLISVPGFDWGDKQIFECTSYDCGCHMTVLFKPPRLRQQWVRQLTDSQDIRSRAEQVMAKDPEKFEGIAPPTPVSTLEYLLSYVTNSLFEPEPGRKIKVDNKKFTTQLGEACSEMLKYIGFTQDEKYWYPPSPEGSPDSPLAEPQQVLLDDVREELTVLLSDATVGQNQLRNPKFMHRPKPAIPAMRVALSCQEYAMVPHAETADLSVDEHPCYAGLGTLADFHDDLIGFAYYAQISADPDGATYYLECLQTLAGGRQSEELQTKVAIEATEGHISLKDIRTAYRSLGLSAYNPPVSDDLIIGSFQARLHDSPRQEAEIRHNLRIIGKSRNSSKIEAMASEDVNTYEQALQFLGADETISDEFIPSLVKVKVEDKPGEESLARQAVALIANQRRSVALKTWLETGNLGEVEMDVGAAYARLDITDRKVDDNTVLAAYDINLTDQPSQIGDLNRALTAIAKSRDSTLIKQRLGLDTSDSKHKLSEWPVGIDNIGNTCYLNSLLQFYFTIKPLRDIVLNIGEHKMPSDDPSLASRRVGGRIVSQKEVMRAQRFVDELRILFEHLITSTQTSFRPSPDVARLTLLSSSKAEIARRQSMISAERPSFGTGLGQINGMSVQGPMGPPIADAPTKEPIRGLSEVEAEEQSKIEDPSALVNGDDQSEASSRTLVENAIENEDAMLIDVQDVESPQKVVAEKDNTASPGALSDGSSHSAKEIRPLHEPSPSPAPDRPPPYPPRPQLQREASDALKEAEYGAQQDVTEVIANVLFQLECAIRPAGFERNGEQLDQIKQLFFAKQKSFTTNKAGAVRTSEEYVTDIKVDVASGSRDIYAALDGAFDVQDVEVAGGIEPQYATISQLPPILSILIQRAQFDPAKKTTFKSENHLEMKETIYMDRYMDSDDPTLKERRDESWAWKRRLAQLEKRLADLRETDLDMPVTEMLNTTREYLASIHGLDDAAVTVPPALIDGIGNVASEAVQEQTAIEAEIKDLQSSISSQFIDMCNIPYRLAAVFVHVGSHSTGHYWIYIYDFSAKHWRKYNDEKVLEVVDTREIFEAPKPPRPPTPYYLVYVKDSIAEDLVDPVCRDVVDLPPDESQDVAMDEFTEIPINVTSEMIEDAYRPIMTQRDQVMTDGRWSTNEGW